MLKITDEMVIAFDLFFIFYLRLPLNLLIADIIKVMDFMLIARLIQDCEENKIIQCSLAQRATMLLLKTVHYLRES